MLPQINEITMHVALFATCLIDAFRPNAGFATVSLLEKAGCHVDVPQDQTCCGQPAYNNGDINNSRIIAKQVIKSLINYDYVVIPSASCAGMMIQHYPKLFEGNPKWQKKALELSERCFELINFLHDILNIHSVDLKSNTSITYHDSCSSLREHDSKQKIRNILNHSNNITLSELNDPESCCGFGGTFCVKFPEISQHIVDEKVNDVVSTGADILVSADLGCLLNISGRLKRLNSPVKVFHIAELLADMTDVADIGDTVKQPDNAVLLKQ